MSKRVRKTVLSNVCWGALGSGLLAAACGAEAGSELAEVDTRDQDLYGSFATASCTIEQRDTLAEAHRAGMSIAMTDAFDACLRRRVVDEYKPCHQGSGDPFSNDARSTQYAQALAIMRSGNTADVTVTCKDLPDVLGNTSIDGYGDTHETLNMDRGFIDANRLDGVIDWERADLAGTIWHEAMHQQGYRHDNCGYPEAEYARGSNSIPYMADRCMRSAGVVGRVYAKGPDGRKYSLGIGRHRATTGDFGGISLLTLGPATRVHLCAREDGNGLGIDCTVKDNPLTEYAEPMTVDLGPTALVLVEPLVLLFSQPDYRGNVQFLPYGEHLANTGGFASVGNDQTQSIYVPPGARVRVCTDEGGMTGHGFWSCQFYDRPTPGGVLAGGISYAEVQPVVTAFTEFDLYGRNTSFGPGRWASFTPLGDNSFAGLVVPDGLTARVCSDWSPEGAGTCQTLTRTSFDLGFSLTHAVSFLEVTPAALGTFPLTVTRAAGSGPGRVTSSPFNLSCTAGSCTAEFAQRTEVFLSAASSGHSASWTGCDRVSNGACVVTMMSAKSVSFLFTPNPPSPPNPPTNTCYRDCVAGCRADGFTARQCQTLCRNECN